MRTMILSAAILLVAACAPPSEVDACGATGLSGLVGAPVAAAEALDRKGPVRILHPETPRTEEYAPARLNVEVGPDGLITALWCG